ncbi:MAG: glutamyl-tRNA(Gln) amidotransferase subunit A (Glu-ADT subunit A) [Rhodospirillaceae bacterium]|nr:glutamyl-tRNA(Gln) amidotransferase subunit A (Glu-ADT subunit A) [Rhodospirillaceae bacterium]
MNGSAVAATEACLENIHKYNEAVNAVVTWDEDAALKRAAEVDRAAAEGRWLGLLHGMTMTLKDNIATAGMRTTSGAKFFADHVPNEDADVVRRLRAAGAVLIGKANMQELAFGVVTNNPVFGQCRNPWNTEHIPGGTSGGSGASVVAEMCRGSLGTDTGGSVRIPAAMTGIAGLRPTHGRISIRGVTPASVGNDTIGPMAREVTDVARLFVALSGYDPEDPVSADVALENFLPRLTDGIQGIRIGIARHFHFQCLHPEVEQKVLDTIPVFERLGAEIREITLPGAELAQDWNIKQIYGDICHHFRDRLNNEPGSFSPRVLARIKLGMDFSAMDYAEAMRGKEVWRRTLKRVFQDEVDIILAPTVPMPPPAITGEENLHEATRDAARFTYGSALSSHPGLSVPCGFTSDGLPIGVMLEAKWWNEALLFRAGVAYQSMTDWHRRRPALLTK